MAVDPDNNKSLLIASVSRDLCYPIIDISLLISCSEIPPLANSRVREGNCSMSDMLCVDITTAQPLLAILWKISMMSSAVTGSRFPVGSSASIRRGLFTKARAMVSRCCSPPESSKGIL